MASGLTKIVASLAAAAGLAFGAAGCGNVYEMNYCDTDNQRLYQGESNTLATNTENPFTVIFAESDLDSDNLGTVSIDIGEYTHSFNFYESGSDEAEGADCGLDICGSCIYTDETGSETSNSTVVTAQWCTGGYALDDSTGYQSVGHDSAVGKDYVDVFLSILPMEGEECSDEGFPDEGAGLEEGETGSLTFLMPLEEQLRYMDIPNVDYQPEEQQLDYVA